jgi:condensin complex subunit 2
MIGPANSFLAEADAGGANKPNKRQKKQAVKIDFMTPSEKDLKDITKELFAGVKKGTSINLPGAGGTSTGKKGSKKKKEKRNDHRLPDDIHFSSRQLVTLFLKPKFSVRCQLHPLYFRNNTIYSSRCVGDGLD